MTSQTPHSIHTGGDPRTLPEYATLRDEISKLSHPARPDVDWPRVETLCLTLFEQNGVELQSAAWFTLARTQNAGLSGLNEGLAVIQALVVHQWAELWPQALQPRTDIISAMSRRLQGTLRGWRFQHDDALPELRQCVALLESLREALSGYGMRDAGQTAALCQQVKYAITRLEESATAPQSPLQQATSPAPRPDTPAPRVYVIQQEPEVQVEIQQVLQPASFLRPFISGACCALLAGAIVLTGTTWYRHHQSAVQQAEQGQIAQQRQTALAEAEQQRRSQQAMPLARLESWHQGMSQLQQMADQLNGLDKTRGKYLTVSELKTGIFSAMQAFNQQVPVEEQLRRLAAGSGNQNSEQVQAGMTLQQLQDRYQLLIQAPAEVGRLSP